MTMEALAKYLSSQVDGPVVDETGLKGEYEIDISWVPDPTSTQRGASAAVADSGLQRDGAASTPGGDLFSVLKQSLGLRLEARRTPVEVVVIDHIERVPTGN